MDVLKLSLLKLLLVTTGCAQVTYLTQAGLGQVSILNKKRLIKDVLSDEKVSADVKKKLLLVREVKEFAENELSLAKSTNYTSYVDLNRPSVSYALSAAPKWKFKSHTWDFPIVGEVPYLGYFDEKDARAEEKKLADEGYDTYVRGISAYSTLGWFSDPVLSSMLTAKEHWLVDTIIHETVHATLFIKGSVDFNERLATFIAQVGTERFFLRKEGKDSPTLKQIKNEHHDLKIFSVFISKELSLLKAWYEAQANQKEEDREKRLAEIQKRFESELEPKLKTNDYAYFKKIKLNNARLLLYQTYVQDLSDFQKLFDRVGGNFSQFLEQCRTLEAHSNPELGLKELAQL